MKQFLSELIINLVYGSFKPVLKILEEQSALTEESAVHFEEDWLLNRGLDQSQLIKSSFLKSTLDGRFWLDKNALTAKVEHLLFILAIVGMVLLLIVLLVIVFIELSS